MKQFKIINAYKTLETLSENENLTELDQWNIYKIRKILRPHVEFQEEREQSVREKYQPYADNEGVLKGEKYLSFMQEMYDLSQLDVEIDAFNKPQIKAVKGITYKIIEPLEDFIDFVEPEVAE